MVLFDCLCHVHFCQGSEFLRGFRSADQNGLAAAWDEIHNPQAPQFQGRGSLTNFPLEHNRVQPYLDGKEELLCFSFGCSAHIWGTFCI